MKTLFSVLIFVLFLNFTLAAQIESSENVSLGENMIIKITGNFYDDLVEENIHFYRGHLVTAFPAFNITEIDGDYYFFVQVPLEKIPGDYSIVLDNTRYYLGARVVDDPVYFNFTVNNDEVPFRFSPGFIVVNESYNVTFQNLEPEKITITWDRNEETTEDGEKEVSFWDKLFGVEPENPQSTTTYDGSIELKSGEEKTVEFDLNDYFGFFNNYFYYNDKTYKILIYSNLTDSNLTGSENSTNFYDDEENVTTDNNEDINKDEENTTDEENKTVDENKTDDEEKVIYTDFTCDELGYEKCIADVQVCDGEEVNAKDAVCCIGQCVEDKPDSTWSVIGWSLLGIVVLFFVWFYITKFSKTKKTPGIFGKKK